MKITQVYIVLEQYSYEPIIRAKYQFLSNYLTLQISDWLKNLKLDFGLFNRIVFEEGAADDLTIVGDRAFVVCIAKDFQSITELKDESVIHDYFVRKYLEGFERLDSHSKKFFGRQSAHGETRTNQRANLC